MKYAFSLFFTLVFNTGINTYAQTIESPSDFLRYPLGTKFTYHHKVVDYFQYIANKSDNVQLYEYGQTYERRELNVAYISSPENLKKLDEIRTNNLKRTGLIDGSAKDDEVVIVWLSYNVHGNEANSTETSMKVLYELVSGKDKRYVDWLDKLVIIIDPCLNPDGRDRYTNWFNQVASKSINPNINTREHHEGWTHGRSNHYLFDLNRDWVWQTQIESKQRLKLYNEWLPHVHVDFHEQFFNSQYYFAPAAEPMHEQITEWQKEFQGIVGKNNAKYFDERGWLYFTRETFDLLYPAYGDTYPMFNGAIGMTYEMPGHSTSGLAIKTNKGDTLTLNDRIDMHFTTSMSTLEACYQNRESLIEEFSDFYTKNKGKDEYYILKSNRQDRISLLTELLENNKIIYKTVSKSKSLKAFSFDENEMKSIQLNANDLVVPTDQPKSTLVKVLFEKNTKLSDTLTYDITAWSLPFMYGLNAYQYTGKLDVSEYTSPTNSTQKSAEKPYAYLLNWTSIKDAKFLSTLLNHGFKINYSTKSFSYKGTNYSAGTLIINRIDNEKELFFEKIIALAKEQQRNLVAVESGASISSIDLGSHKINFLKKPRIAMQAGKDIGTLNFGELWYFFEQELNYPIDIIKTDIMDYIDLDDYDILVLASGKYSSLQTESGFKKIDGWIKGGGNLILLENAINGFIGENKFALEKNDQNKDKEEEDPKPVLYSFEDNERENLKKYIQGGIIKLKLDNSHPLAYGYDNYYYTLKTNNRSYRFLNDGWNVGYITAPEETVAGFVGSETKKLLGKNMVFGVEQRGRGHVIYFADNPNFRSFWQNGKLFLANAIFFND